MIPEFVGEQVPRPSDQSAGIGSAAHCAALVELTTSPRVDHRRETLDITFIEFRKTISTFRVTSCRVGELRFGPRPYPQAVAACRILLGPHEISLDTRRYRRSVAEGCVVAAVEIGIEADTARYRALGLSEITAPIASATCTRIGARIFGAEAPRFPLGA